MTNELKRYNPALTNTATPWPNLDVKLLEASMSQSPTGVWVRYEDVKAYEQKLRADAVREFFKWIKDYPENNISDAAICDYVDKIERGEL